MEFLLLGPLEVRKGESVVALGGTRQGALLAVLLLHANEVVSRDRLIDELWGEGLARGAGHRLDLQISRLRKTLELGGQLVTRRGGYALEVDPMRIDAHRFECLLAEGRQLSAAGRAGEAADALREALALWRGGALDDLAYEPFARLEIERLEELRVVAVEERIDVDLVLGRHHAVVPELEVLTAKHPLRERLRGQLMLALYRSGRQAEALRVYAETRRRLVDELGTEPTSSLRDLERAILAHDPSIAPPSPTAELAVGSAAGESRGRPVFVGRRSELDRLEVLYEGALAGAARIVLLVGEPGIGKTRTAHEFAGSAAARGASVLWGRCYERQGAPPYWPWTQAVRSLVRARDPDRLRSELGAGAGVIADVVADVRERLPELEAPVSLEDPRQARFRLFDSLTAFLRATARTQPVVLVMEDLHWADAGSLLLLEFFAREVAPARVLLIGTYRDLELTPQHPFLRTLAELTRDNLMERIPLAGLSEEEVGRFVEANCAVKPPPELVRAVNTQTEGNPLFLTEVVRLLTQEGTLTPEGLARGANWAVRVPEGVRAVIGQRLARRSEHCHDVLVVAAVIGREFEFGQLSRLHPLASEEDLLGALEEALAARLIDELPGSTDRYQFAHALIGACLVDELSAARRARLHGRIAEAFEDLYDRDVEAHAAELAYHYAEAAPVLGTERVVAFSRIAGEKAIAAHAYEEAIVQFERALTAKGTGPMDDDRAALLFGLARAELGARELYELGPTLARLRDAFDHYDSIGEQTSAVAVATHPIPPVWEPTDIPRVITRAQKLVPEGSLDCGRLLSTSGWFLATHERDHHRAEIAFERSLEIARQHGDEALERRTLVTAAHADYWHLEWDSCRERGLRAVELARRANDQRTEMSAHEWPARVAAIKGDPDEAKLHGAAAVELAERLRERHALANAYMYSGWLYALQGDWQTARQLSDDALTLQPREPRNLATRALLEIQTGGTRSGEAYIEQLLDPARITKWSLMEKFALAAFIPMAARITGNEERLDLAAETAHAALAAPGMPPFMRLYGRIGLAFVAIIRDDRDLAAEQYNSFESQRHTAIVMAGLSVDRLLGLLSLAAGRRKTALAHFEDALAFCRRAGYEPEYAWTASDHAEALRLQGHIDDIERATTLQRDASSIASRLEMRPLQERTSAVQADARV